MNKPMRCPFCGKSLIKGEPKQFENLADHVSDPNMNYHPMRETYICTCEKSNNAFWDSWGDYYSRKYHGGKTEAINSGAWKFEKQLIREKVIRKLPFGKLLLNLITKLTIFEYKLMCKIKGYSY